MCLGRQLVRKHVNKYFSLLENKTLQHPTYQKPSSQNDKTTGVREALQWSVNIMESHAPSVPLALVLGRVRRAGAAARVPQQRRAEYADDAEVEDEADDQHADGPQEGGRGSVGRQPRLPLRHVRQDALHLEVGPHHGTDVEELVAVACGGGRRDKSH